MDIETLNAVYSFWQDAVQVKDWKEALDFLFASLREQLVFDNLAIYTTDTDFGQTTKVAYARAVGREKQAEADATWGEDIAKLVLETTEIIVKTPQDTKKTKNRLQQPYLIGLPLKASGDLVGAMVLVRFGGPDYTKEQALVASLASILVAYIFEKRTLQKNIAELEAVQRQMRLQDDFVATMSHELRTPLGFIKGYSTTLLREDTTWKPETQREFLTIIDEETDHLTELIENILESARLESQTLEMSFQPLRIDVLIRDVITRSQARYKELNVHFFSECTTQIKGDSSRLTQIFENLFSNVVKYAPQSDVTIAIKALQDFVQVTFSDNGPGIPAGHLPFIFDRFYRVPGAQNSAGTGLGLFICKRIIQVHHGKIWAESANQQGTTFYINLPIPPDLEN